MFCVGEQVVYGIHGVCSVAALEKRMVDRKMVTYLVLEPLGQRGSRYLVPTHNALAMAKVRPMLTKGEMAALLDSAQVHEDAWISDENQRKQCYRELIGSGDRERLLQMTHTLYRHKKQQAEAGKKCHMCDDNFLRDAEKLLIGEISVVMEMEPEQAKTYIRQHLA